MSSVKLTVVHPTVRDDGSAGEAVSWRVEAMLAAAQNWSPLGTERPAADTEAVHQNLFRGVYQYRVTWKDSDNQDSEQVVIEVSVGGLPAKLIAGNVTAEVLP
jgi:hypothetical protein